METADKIENFEYSICLHYFDREELMAAFVECGFAVVNEYSDRQNTAWTEEENFWNVELMRL